MKINYPKPDAMPNVKKLQVYLPDIQLALTRAENAWNITQFVDAVNSVQFFLMEIQNRVLTK